MSNSKGVLQAHNDNIKMQLDIEVSPPVSLIVEQVYVQRALTIICMQMYTYQNTNFCPINFGQVTDGQMDRQKVMHKSSPCISTGGFRYRDLKFY